MTEDLVSRLDKTFKTVHQDTNRRGLHPMTPDLAPYLFYDDVDAAARFLQEAFGFRVGFTSRDPEGRLQHAQLLHGAALIMLGHAGGGGLGLVKTAASLP